MRIFSAAPSSTFNNNVSHAQSRFITAEFFLLLTIGNVGYKRPQAHCVFYLSISKIACLGLMLYMNNETLYCSVYHDFWDLTYLSLSVVFQLISELG